MKNYLIADRYSTALDHGTRDDAGLPAVLEALDALATAYRDEENFRSVLMNPAIQLDTRCAVLAEAATKISAPESVRRLLEVLMRRGRIALLPDIARIFSDRADIRLNQIGAEVTTAVPLGDAQRDAMRGALEEFSGGTVHLHERVDGHLLGGAVAKIGSVLIDGSVRSRLRRMREAVMSDER